MPVASVGTNGPTDTVLKETLSGLGNTRHHTGQRAPRSGLTAGGLPCCRHHPQGLGEDPGKTAAAEPQDAAHQTLLPWSPQSGHFLSPPSTRSHTHVDVTATYTPQKRLASF